jgi:hypothetical protein
MRVMPEPAAESANIRWITSACAELMTRRAGGRCVPLPGPDVLARTLS